MMLGRQIETRATRATLLLEHRAKLRMNIRRKEVADGGKYVAPMGLAHEQWGQETRDVRANRLRNAEILYSLVPNSMSMSQEYRRLPWNDVGGSDLARSCFATA